MKKWLFPFKSLQHGSGNSESLTQCGLQSPLCYVACSRYRITISFKHSPCLQCFALPLNYQILTQNGINSLNASNPQIVYIASEPDSEQVYYRHTQDLYQSIGANLDVYIELEAGFDDAIKQMFKCDAIHLCGGDTFRFLKWLKARNLLESLQEYAQGGGAIIGVSAGAMIMTASIETARLCGDINTVALNDLKGLALVPHIPVSISTYAEYVAYLVNTGMEGIMNEMKGNLAKLYLCNDNASIAVIDDEIYTFGDPLIRDRLQCGS